MKFLKQDADFAKRVEKVFECMEENGVQIEYMGGEFRFTDTTTNNRTLHNMPLLDAEFAESVQTLPPVCEYKITVFDS